MQVPLATTRAGASPVGDASRVGDTQGDAGSVGDASSIGDNQGGDKPRPYHIR